MFLQPLSLLEQGSGTGDFTARALGALKVADALEVFSASDAPYAASASGVPSVGGYPAHLAPVLLLLVRLRKGMKIKGRLPCLTSR